MDSTRQLRPCRVTRLHRRATSTDLLTFLVATDQNSDVLACCFVATETDLFVDKRPGRGARLIAKVWEARQGIGYERGAARLEAWLTASTSDLRSAVESSRQSPGRNDRSLIGPIRVRTRRSTG